MLYEYKLNEKNELEYARKWAYGRSPAFLDFSPYGGDCTNFCSQCIYAGGAVMNYTPDTGWYYISPNDRAAAWTGVEYLYRFLTTNKGAGPFGEEAELYKAKPCDIIQLGNAEGFYHSLFVVGVIDGIIYVSAHTNDTYFTPLESYYYERARCIHIKGARKWH